MALVGTSGCGKSTTVALVERLYDINSGSLVRTKNLCFIWYRVRMVFSGQHNFGKIGLLLCLGTCHDVFMS